jgi:hypothetical protein
MDAKVQWELTVRGSSPVNRATGKTVCQAASTPTN